MELTLPLAYIKVLFLLGSVGPDSLDGVLWWGLPLSSCTSSGGLARGGFPPQTAKDTSGRAAMRRLALMPPQIIRASRRKATLDPNRPKSITGAAPSKSHYRYDWPVRQRQSET